MELRTTTSNIDISVEGATAVGKRRKAMRASIYLLPNLITATSLLCGFLSMKLSIEGRMSGSEVTDQFIWAVYAILAAAVCDGLDGSVARLTRTQSAFGVQLDSLCDLVSFGAAPALLAYNYSMHDMGRLGFGAVFIYAACGALRLARFNVQSSLGKASGNFTGIPIPMAAMSLCVFILAQHELTTWTADNGYAQWAVNISTYFAAPGIRNMWLVGIVFLLAFGMISTFEYVSTKNLRLPKKRPFQVLAAVVMTAVLFFSLEFTMTLALLMLVYCVHGPLMWLFLKRDRQALDEELFTAGNDEDDEEEAYR